MDFIKELYYIFISLGHKNGSLGQSPFAQKCTKYEMGLFSYCVKIINRRGSINLKYMLFDHIV